MNCVICEQPIPKGRLEALPDTDTCVKCSTVEKKIAVTVWEYKTPEVLIMEAEQAEKIGQLDKIDGRLNRL